ncbi:ROK family protein [Archaeoglobus profundus]|uniref:ROK family protein n=1 Tax=Archaeoglobus profundus (strain DSM 5631 / JCM 9629 / NBRC 100127 / Av18) TaxID=572546 RepID=D2RF67_ARCPA|nr:ROK family protein [Archaeoglobus profundus]ADB58761.1 ROK family protein [Archaeoglobus profundus DSM 5631]
MILGVDIGGTNIDVVLYDGKFVHIATYPTQSTITRLNDVLKELVDEYKVDAVGIGFAGWIRENKILKAPNVNFKPDFDLNVPYKLDNDANCFALYASHHFKLSNVLGITIGTGIGSGIIVDGKVYRGMGLAGEIGHWFVGGDDVCTCGGKGHLECYFGGWSFKKRGLNAIELVESGEVYELEDFEKLCICVANAITLLDPEAVVFGGRIGGSLDEKILRERLYRHLMPEFRPKIKTLKDPLAVAKGACLMVMK